MNNLSPPLRFRTGWLGIGWSLVIAVIISSLAASPPAANSLFLLPYGDKIAHCFAYLVIMGWFAQIYHAPKSRLGYLIGFILLGVVMEILQGLGGIREADWRDAMANSVGVILAWQVTKNRWREVLVWVERWYG
jgi:VanZ family protein